MVQICVNIMVQVERGDGNAGVAFIKERVLMNVKESIQQRFVKGKTYTLMLNNEVLAGIVMPEGGRYGIVDFLAYAPEHILGLSRRHLPALFYIRYKYTHKFNEKFENIIKMEDIECIKMT